jgi:chemotaxis receptor (MCP) glutamine deamidase CheD
VKEVTIYIGGVHASSEPALVKTLLGSCIAVCLHDPGKGIGGMNHFMLPDGATGDGERTRFGVHAMDCLIGAIQKLGGDRRRLVAKVFGGAHVLAIRESSAGVPQQNIDFVKDFLREEGLRVISEDLGGYHPRHVHFQTASGRAFVKRVGSKEHVRVLTEQAKPVPVTAVSYGDVVLF